MSGSKVVSAHMLLFAKSELDDSMTTLQSNLDTLCNYNGLLDNNTTFPDRNVLIVALKYSIKNQIERIEKMALLAEGKDDG